MWPTKIVRRPDRVGGGITEAERQQMAEHVKLWVSRAFRTEPIDPDKITPAILGLYAAAGLKAPRVVIVPSPLVMAVAGGLAAGVWALRGTDATLNATRAATDDATYDATYDATRWVRLLAEQFGGRNYQQLLNAVTTWYTGYQGGNMWAAWDCYLTAYRDILGLRLPQYAAYNHWEQAAIHGGFRYMHPEFCMVSDFPERLLVDDRNRPHCADGPSHRWRDGWSLYHWHGVRVPQQVIEAPETLTVAQIQAERNAEVRRVMMERYGWERYAKASGAMMVHRDDYGTLWALPRPGQDPLLCVEVVNATMEPDGTFKHYWLAVRPGCTTALEAVASTFRTADGTRMTAKQYQQIAVHT